MLKTRVERRELLGLTLLSAAVGHENARFMPRRQFNRLVENIRRDGTLTSAPLIGQVEGDERWYVISGNHRVEAAIAAGLLEADCVVVDGAIDQKRFVALQLSHNAIEGEDDPATLKRLYDMLNLDLKEYSGLTDDRFNMDALNVKTLPSATLGYLDVVFSFLSDEADAVAEFIARAERHAKKATPIYLADYRDFDRFIDTLTAVKKHHNIKNSALALRSLCDLAMRALEDEIREGEKA